MSFGPDLACNQISFESLDTDPAWAGLYDIPDGTPTHCTYQELWADRYQHHMHRRTPVALF